MKMNLLHIITPKHGYRQSVRRLPNAQKMKHLRNRKIALAIFAAGMVLASADYLVKMQDWSYTQEIMTLGFAGYILMISAAASLLVNILRVWSAENETWQS